MNVSLADRLVFWGGTNLALSTLCSSTALIESKPQARLLQLKMGRIDVRFKKPFSLKNYLETETARRRALKPQPADNLSAPSLLSTTTSQPSFAAETTEDVKYASVSEKRDSTVLLQSLAYRIMSDINSVSVIMPAALVGSIMLTIRGRGVGRSGTSLDPLQSPRSVRKADILI